MQDADTAVEPNDGLAEAMAMIPQEPEPSGDESGDKTEGGESEGGQSRDERGRFAKADAEAGGGKDDNDDLDKRHFIPLGEHLSEREKRQAAERRAEEAERRWQEHQHQLAQQRQRQEAETEESIPDPIADPQGYDRYIRSSFSEQLRSELRKQRVDDSFDAMAEKHGDAFEKAVDEFTAVAGQGGSRDRALFGRIVDSRNPGRALWSWYQDRRTMTEIGGDLEGYQKKLWEQWKSDPERRKEFMATLESEARGSNGRSETNVTSLPSVNRASGKGGSSSQQPGSLGSSDGEIFDSLTRPRRA